MYFSHLILFVRVDISFVYLNCNWVGLSILRIVHWLPGSMKLSRSLFPFWNHVGTIQRKVNACFPSFKIICIPPVFSLVIKFWTSLWTWTWMLLQPLTVPEWRTHMLRSQWSAQLPREANLITLFVMCRCTISANIRAAKLQHERTRSEKHLSVVEWPLSFWGSGWCKDSGA